MEGSTVCPADIITLDKEIAQTWMQTPSFQETGNINESSGKE